MSEPKLLSPNTVEALCDLLLCTGPNGKNRAEQLRAHIAALEEDRTQLRAMWNAALADNAALVEGLRALVSGLDAEVTYTKDMEKDMQRMGHEKADIDGVRQRLTALARVGHFRPSSDLLTTTHPGAALLEEHRRALVRARNEGLEKAARDVSFAINDALTDYLSTQQPPGFTINTAIRAAQKCIRAMKEPEE